MRSMLRSRLVWTDDRLRIETHALIAGMVAAYLVGLLFVGLTRWLPSILAVPPVVVTLSLVPGGLALVALSDQRRIGTKWVTLAFGTSLVLLTGLGLVLNLSLPAVGYERPLSVVPLVISVSLLVCGLGVIAYGVRENRLVEIPLPTTLSPAPLAFALLPLASVLGVWLLNSTGSNWLILLVLGVIASVPLVVFLAVRERWHGFAIWTMALAIVYHDATTAGKSFPGNAVIVRIWRAARWEPGTLEGGRLASELLQHGTIFPAFANLTDVDVMTQMTLVNPFFVSFIPVALFVAFRHYLDSRHAFLGASLFAFAHPFYNQYPTAGRSATPVLFLALFVMLLGDSSFRSSVRSGLAILFLGGVAVTHYGTSYFLLAAMGGAVAVLVGLHVADGTVERILPPRTGAEGGDISVRSLVRRFAPPVEPRRTIFSVALVTFFGTLVFAWYLHTNGGRAFDLFPRHFVDILEQFVTEDVTPGGGRTGARLERNYGSLAVWTSKRLYVVLGLATVAGLFVSVVRRYYAEAKRPPDDAFIALGTAMLGLFGVTIVARTWGGGRPMMITFTITLMFAVLGVVAVGEQLQRLADRYVPWAPGPTLQSSHVVSAFAVLAAVLFVMSSGVATSVGLSGSPAPSNVPMQDGESLTHVDAGTHAWLIDHHVTGQIYGDNTAFGHTDWIAPAIALRTETGEDYGGARPRNELEPLMSPGADPGFLLLLTHNVESGNLARYSERQPLDVIEPRYLDNRVYTSGMTNITYFGDPGD